MKRALVTGANGFVGRHTLPLLIERGFELHTAGRSRPTEPEAVHHTLDLLDSRAVVALVHEVRPTHVLHLAWCTEHGAYWAAAENLAWVESGVALIRALVDIGGVRLVGAGSCAEYDWSAGHCVEDETPMRPATLYGSSKYALGELLLARARAGGLGAAWGRIFLAYGAFENPSRLVPQVVCNLLRGERAACTHGEQLRAVMHVEDVAGAFVHLLDGDAQGAFNVCSGEPVKLRTVVEAIAEKLGRPELLALGALPSRPNEPLVLTGSGERLRRCGFAPTVSLSAGIDRTIAWWRRREQERA